MGEVGALFDRFAATYDDTRRRLIPEFESFYATAVEVATLRLPTDRVPRVLDLGAGTGLLSALVAAACPAAQLVLVDAAPAMLERAPERLGADWARCQAIVCDFSTEMPDGPFDAVVTALAVHHLPDHDKRRLYARVHDRLVPGGVFVNAEQVAGPTSGLDALYTERWMAHTTALGITPHEHVEAAARMALDLPSPAEEQCGWLRDTGFVDVDCFFKSWRFAVFGGWRAV